MTQTHGPHEDRSAHTEEMRRIERDIDETRGAINEDLRAIGEKLSAENLKYEAKQAMSNAKEAGKERVREAKDAAVERLGETFEEVRYGARRASERTMGFARTNALPLAFIGVGAAWLVSKSRHTNGDGRPEGDWSRSSRARNAARNLRERTSTQARHVRERVEQARGSATDRVGEVTERAQHAAHEAGAKIRHTFDDEYGRARERSHEMMENRPLLLGAVAVAAGFGVGLLLPVSVREREALGHSRDRLFGEAKTFGSQAKRLAHDVATDAKQVAEDFVTR